MENQLRHVHIMKGILYTRKCRNSCFSSYVFFHVKWNGAKGVKRRLFQNPRVGPPLCRDRYGGRVHCLYKGGDLGVLTPDITDSRDVECHLSGGEGTGAAAGVGAVPHWTRLNRNLFGTDIISSGLYNSRLTEAMAWLVDCSTLVCGVFNLLMAWLYGC